MKIKYVSFIAILLAAILQAACGAQPGSGSTDDSGNVSNSVSGSTGGIVSGACDNPLYPVKVGDTWNYNVTGIVSSSFTRTILEVTDTDFTDQDTFPGPVTRIGQWACDAGNLTSLTPSEGPSGEVQSTGTSTDIQTSDLTGMTLPASIQAGDTWNQHMIMTGNTVVSDTTAQSSTEMTMSCTADGSESVTATAGTFDAMKVTCQTTMVMTITLSGVTVPTTLVLTTVNWYAPGVGLVRSVTTGENLDSTIDLTSYTLQ